MNTTLKINIPNQLYNILSSILKKEHLRLEEYLLKLLKEDISQRQQELTLPKTSLTEIFDIAPSCQDTNLSENHNQYLYRANPQ